MNIRFYLDPATRELGIYGHGVIEHEVADFLPTPGEDRPGRDKPRYDILDLSRERNRPYSEARTPGRARDIMRSDRG
jgi:hypothetical protein